MCKKRHILACGLLGAFTFFSANSNAASQSTLKIKGKIIPDSCNIAMDNQGVLKIHGSDTSTSSRSEKIAPLPEQVMYIHIECRNPTSFGIRVTDLSANAGNITINETRGKETFSLGQTHNGEAIGGFIAEINKQNSWIDGKQLNNVITSLDEGRSWQVLQDPLFANGENIYSWSDTLLPARAKQVKINLTIYPFLFKKNYSDIEEIDGMTNFELVYL